MQTLQLRSKWTFSIPSFLIHPLSPCLTFRNAQCCIYSALLCSGHLTNIHLFQRLGIQRYRSWDTVSDLIELAGIGGRDRSVEHWVYKALQSSIQWRHEDVSYPPGLWVDENVFKRASETLGWLRKDKICIPLDRRVRTPGDLVWIRVWTWNNGFTIGIRPYRFVGAAWDAEVWQGPGGAAERNHWARTMKRAEAEVNRRQRVCCCWWAWCCSRSAGLREDWSEGRQGKITR